MTLTNFFMVTCAIVMMVWMAVVFTPHAGLKPSPLLPYEPEMFRILTILLRGCAILGVYAWMVMLRRFLPWWRKEWAALKEVPGWRRPLRIWRSEPASSFGWFSDLLMGAMLLLVVVIGGTIKIWPVIRVYGAIVGPLMIRTAYRDFKEFRKEIQRLRSIHR